MYMYMVAIGSAISQIAFNFAPGSSSIHGFGSTRDQHLASNIDANIDGTSRARLAPDPFPLGPPCTN